MRYILSAIIIIIFAATSHAATVDINSGDSPSASLGHYAGGQKHLVRFDSTVIALVSDGTSQYTYRSEDNAVTWSQIDTDGTYSGCLLRDATYVYHFYRGVDNIYMVRFLPNAVTIGTPTSIYYNVDIDDSNTGAYRSITGSIDSSGRIYLAYHYDNGAVGSDSLYVLVSDTSVSSWTNYLVDQGSGTNDENYTDPSIQVATDDTIYISYSTFNEPTSGEMSRLATSTDSGATWTDQAISTGDASLYNTHVLPTTDSELYIFAQDSGSNGLVFIKSTNSGSTWSSWSSIDTSPTSLNHYADPSAALASNGDIYVAYRSSSKTVSPDTTYYSRLARSSDGGATWDFPWMYDSGDPMMIKSSLRYQTWFSGGGQLEHVWMQDTTITPTYYHSETGISIKSSWVTQSFMGTSLSGASTQ